MSTAPALRLVDPDTPVPGSEATERILDATLVLVARWGVAKTALATSPRRPAAAGPRVYRIFPGGKQHLFQALARGAAAASRRDRRRRSTHRDELDDALIRRWSVAPALVHDHDAAQFILEHEPDLFLPFLGFHQVDRLYRATSAAVGPHLARFLPPTGRHGPPSGPPACSHLPVQPGRRRGPRRRSTTPADLVSRFLLPAFADPPLHPSHHLRSRHVHQTRRPATKSSSAEPTSTTSRPSCRSPTPTSTRPIHAVKDNADAIFTWDYEKGARPALNKLYEKAKHSMWNGETDLPWDTEVDQEAGRRRHNAARRQPGDGIDLTGTPFENWGDKRVDRARHRVAELDASASSCTASRAR